MANRIFHLDLCSGIAAFEKDLHGVGDGALVRLQIFAAVARLLLHHHFRAQGIDARIGGGGILVMTRVQFAE